MDLRKLIRDIPDYPKQGILFFDITPLLGDPDGFRKAVDLLAERFADAEATKIVAAEARGFIFGAALAYKMGIGFVPVRKPGKLPYKTRSVSYDLEYGSDTLCMHEDALLKGEKVLVIDDLLATGGTLSGVVKLIEDFGAKIAGIGVVIELSFLNGREQFKTYGCESILQIA
ncbi:adenine phosphoribosyltransferase [Solidesulfovibrio sp.]|jgi:adenine phosphoribosyltransferase|uniref:adenine phosphoribosyltransferase n=1 Tax=Solidesulfovibrio sp. TaxID=2910990 RepID=UPI000EF09E8A|nr:adenine phosphoribosyltransferase [Solidesulfovibrio sp.]MEA5090252.1 adenine phosphoribosyltransferase [Solidesulfovibrio sp.]HCR14582.1 adenine phosphoribosyltransferase [Desulfovibrio sp.]HML61150.1 adenine phosphoribosyltransferase [Solidesulfovibrio sp.]